MKQIEVQIMGNGYLLACPEGGEDRLQQAVQRVDRAMCQIRDAGKIRARDRIAVLAALNLAYELDAPVKSPVSSAPTASSNEEQEHALAKLLARLDQALEQDGQLL